MAFIELIAGLVALVVLSLIKIMSNAMSSDGSIAKVKKLIDRKLEQKIKEIKEV